MRPRVPSGDSGHSFSEMMEYGLTAVLVIVVVMAALQICGIHPKWPY